MTTCKKTQPLRFERNLQKIASVVALNEAGRRIGEAHPRAVLDDVEIDHMRERHEEYPPGHPLHMGYRKLAKLFGVSKTAARKICTYAIRAQTISKFKRKGGGT